MTTVKPVRSFEQFNYTLRPAKNIERKMMCETFARLARLEKLAEYRYVGMGSKEFCDFSLIHRQLGIRDMISIEHCVDDRRRFEFNRPYSCIKMRWGTTHEILPKLKWNRRSIVWLDYEDHLNAAILGDIRTLIGNMLSGSVFVVSVKVKPDSDPFNPDPKQRYRDFVARVGKARTPPNVNGGALAGWGLAAVSAQVVFNEVEEARNSRNGKLTDDDKLSYVPLFNFQYADGAQMATFGGLLVNKKDQGQLSTEQFSDLGFIGDHTEPYRIEPPILTQGEIRLLDGRLPRDAPTMKSAKWLPERERRRYGAVYRYFPSFTEVEA